MSTTAPVLRRVDAQAFKSLREASVELAPLTVVVGANSSGKSSLVQIILLLAQAQRQTPAEATVALNGRLVQLGDLSELRNHQVSDDQPVVIGAEFDLAAAPEDARQPMALKWSVRLAAANEALHGAALVAGATVHLDAPTGVLDLDISESSDEQRAQLYARARALGLATGPRQLVGYSGLMTTGDGQAQKTVQGVRLRGAFPAGVLVERDELRELLARAFDRANRSRVQAALARITAHTGSECQEATTDPQTAGHAAAAAAWIEQALSPAAAGSPEVPLQSLAPDAIPDLIAELSRRDVQGRPTLVPAEGETIELLRGASAGLTTYLERHVWYLGVDRQHGNQLSQIAVSGSPTDIGVRGEHVASVLRAYSQREVSSCPEAPSLGPPPETLAEAVNYWARQLGIIAEYEVLDYGPGSELRVTTSAAGRKVDLQHVGAGVAALLPVIVVCLLAEPGALILLEEPELHLHPAVQQRLGDFFLACARSGRQVMVETHSEALITRLRRRVAEDPTGEPLSLVSILFTDLRDGATLLEHVPLNRYGGLDEWPRGFLDEQADDAEQILLAGGTRLAADLPPLSRATEP